MIRQKLDQLGEQAKILREKRVLAEERRKALELEEKIQHWIAMKWMAVATPVLFLIFAFCLRAR